MSIFSIKTKMYFLQVGQDRDGILSFLDTKRGVGFHIKPWGIGERKRSAVFLLLLFVWGITIGIGIASISAHSDQWGMGIYFLEFFTATCSKDMEEQRIFLFGGGGKGFVDVVFFFYLIPRWTLGSIFSLLWLCHVLAVRIKHRRWKYVYVFFEHRLSAIERGGRERERHAVFLFLARGMMIPVFTLCFAVVAITITLRLRFLWKGGLK